MKEKNSAIIYWPLTSWEKWLLLGVVDAITACSRLLARIGWKLYMKIVM